MSTKGNLSRDEAIAQVGLNAIELVESENCEPTNRHQTDGDDSVEFMSTVTAMNKYGDLVELRAYYYLTPKDLDSATDNYDHIDWVIHGYEIEVANCFYKDE